MNSFVGIAVFLVWSAVVAISDCRRRRVSNLLVVAGLAAALGCASLHASPFGVSLVQAGAGAFVGLLALMPFFALGVMGAADVKVFAALGAWCGMDALLGLWMAASLAAGVHALWLLIVTRTSLANLGRAGGADAARGVTFELAGKAATPYAACLTVAASGWLGLQLLAGGLR